MMDNEQERRQGCLLQLLGLAGLALIAVWLLSGCAKEANTPPAGPPDCQVNAYAVVTIHNSTTSVWAVQLDGHWQFDAQPLHSTDLHVPEGTALVHCVQQNTPNPPVVDALVNAHPCDHETLELP